LRQADGNDAHERSELQSFRTDVQRWLQANCPPEMRRPITEEADICWGGRRFVYQSAAQRQWLQSMAAKGWTAPEWPPAYGGAGLSKSEAKVLAQELAALGCRPALQSFGLWMLGPALLKLSNVYLDTLDVRARGMRWTQELARRTGLSVRLGAELFDEVIIIHHNRRPDGSQQMLETGLTIPHHASAMGKILLAYDLDLAGELPEQLRSLTGDTITDPAELRVQLAEIAERGIASEQDEAVLGESSVAAPVVDQSGAVIAAVAVVMPTSEFPPEGSVLNDLREAARNISRELGATGWPPAPQHLV